MIYTVECSFGDPSSEAEWNDFYSFDKLPALISVTGFHTSQRFKALRGGYPMYLAAHSIDGLGILTGEEYSRKGGGNFARWQRHITNWHRNLYDGLDKVKAVEADEVLLLTGVGQPLIRLGTMPHALQAVAMEKFPEHRWLAKLKRARLHDIDGLPQDIHIYEPMTEQLRPMSFLHPNQRGRLAMPNVTIFIPAGMMPPEWVLSDLTDRCSELCTGILKATLDNVHVIYVAVRHGRGHPVFAEIVYRLEPFRESAVMERFMEDLDEAIRHNTGFTARIRCFGYAAQSIHARN